MLANLFTTILCNITLFLSFAQRLTNLLLDFFRVQVIFLVVKITTARSGVFENVIVDPLINISPCTVSRATQHFDGLSEFIRIGFHRINGFHQIRDTANRIAHVFGFENLIRHETINAFNRLVRHKAREGTRCIHCLALRNRIVAATQSTVQSTQILFLGVVLLNAVRVDPARKIFRQLPKWNNFLMRVIKIQQKVILS